MGMINMSWDSLNRIPGLNLANTKMLELGSQQFHEVPRGVNVPYMSYTGDYFRRVCKEFDSIDLNGEGGSLVLDLSTSLLPHPITPLKGYNYYDVVTDFGTSEHVSDLRECRKNCHDYCAVGGYMVYINPMKGHWPQHGNHYFTKDHYVSVANVCNYEIVLLDEVSTMGNWETGMQIRCIMKKLNNIPFPSLSVWNTIYSATVSSV